MTGAPAEVAADARVVDGPRRIRTASNGASPGPRPGAVKLRGLIGFRGECRDSVAILAATPRSRSKEYGPTLLGFPGHGHATGKSECSHALVSARGDKGHSAAATDDRAVARIGGNV